MGFFFLFYQFDPELYFFQCFELFLFQNYAPFPCQLTNSKEESLWRLFVPVSLRFRVRHGTSSAARVNKYMRCARPDGRQYALHCIDDDDDDPGGQRTQACDAFSETGRAFMDRSGISQVCFYPSVQTKEWRRAQIELYSQVEDLFSV